MAGAPTAVGPPESDQSVPSEEDQGGGGPGAEEPAGDEPSEDELLLGVLGLFVGYNSAWEQGFEAGATYQAEHNHPTLDYSVQECLDGYAGTSATYLESLVADTDTLEPDPDWTLTEGRYAGEELDGFIYTVDTIFTHGDPAAEGLSLDELTAHVAFLDGETYFFFICEPTE